MKVCCIKDASDFHSPSIMTFKTILLSLIGVVTASINVMSQTDTIPGTFHVNSEYRRYKKTEIVIGYNLQGNWKDNANAPNRQYVEVGVGRSVQVHGRHGPTSIGYYLSEEIHTGANTIYGTKMGVYAHYLFDFGMAAVYYTDFKKGNFKFRPELGIGLAGFRAVAGFNIPTIDNKGFAALRRNNAQLTIQFLLGVSKKETGLKK